jgi:hypothetical protein
MKKIFLAILVLISFSSFSQEKVHYGKYRYDSLYSTLSQMGLDTTNFKIVVQRVSDGKHFKMYWPTVSTPTLQQVFNTEVGGSVLTKADTIDAGSNQLFITSSKTGNNAGASFNNSSTGSGAYGSSTGGSGVYGTGTTGVTATGSNFGVFATSSSIGIQAATSATGDGNPAGRFQNTSLSSTNTIAQTLSLQRYTSGTPANGIGNSIIFSNPTSTSSTTSSNTIESFWSDVTNATKTSQANITGFNSGSAETFMNIQHGLVRVNNNADTLATKADVRAGGGSTPGIASVLAVNQNMNADGSINTTGSYKLTIANAAPSATTGFQVDLTSNATDATGDLYYRTSNGPMGRIATGTSKQALHPDGSGGYVWKDTTGATSITGTANQVLANGTSGSAQTGAVTLTLPQSINTTSNVTFNSVTAASISATNYVQAAGFKTGYVAKTANYTVATSDYTIDCTSGTFTVTLPSAVGIAGQIFVIKNSGAGTITITPNGAETIDGGASYSLASQYKYVTLQSNGSGMIVIGNN